ncbi:MAG: carbohydrate-binding domain-containing protein [Ruminococcus sp.]|nr:carbohydrate-binding domain-containing protein [Ruminococcus sp.]
MKNNEKIKVMSLLAAAMTFAMMTAGCSGQSSSSSEESESVTVTDSAVSTEAESLSETAEEEPEKTSDSGLFSARDLAQDYGEPTAKITLDGSSAKAEGSGVSVDGSVITITDEGIYLITGSLTDGQIIVDADKAKVQLVLDNAQITCKSGPAIWGKASDKIFLTLAKGSKNSLTDGSSYEDTSEEAPDACVYTKDSLTVNGPGQLTVTGSSANGIHSTDDVVITGGELTVNAENDGIKAKDYFAGAGGSVKITCGGDGIKTTNAEEEGMGFIYIEDGAFTVDAQQDGIQAETDLTVLGGDFDITSGGGSENSTKAHTDEFGGGNMGGFGGRAQRGSSDTQEDPLGIDPDQFGGEKPDFDPEQFSGEAPDFGDFDPGQFGGDMPDGFAPGGFGENEDGSQQFSGRGRRGGRPGEGSEGFDPFSGQAPDGDSRAAPDTDQRPEDMEITPSQQEPESSADSETTVSTKGIKAGGELNISGGTFKLNAADDTIHSNGNVAISGGEISAEAGDDGIHADGNVEISGSAKVDITGSYEGIEAVVITVSGGDVKVAASDDGFNASDGSPQGGMGSYSEGALVEISGGTVYVNASGDGLDSNGDLIISGGTVTVDGPTNSGNGALDSNGEITITGGTVMAAGMSGMAEAPGSGSTQYSVSCTFESTYDGGTEICLLDESGKEILSLAPAKSFDNIVLSSPEISSGKTYTVTADGQEAGTFTAEDIVSFIGRQSSMGGGMGFGGRPGNRTGSSGDMAAEQL